jgi:uncharacterized protein Yka (UPF0111/DUF47 family)
MTDDIVARLRKQYVGNYNALVWDEAADEIERLRTQLEMWQDGNIMAESHRDEIERLGEQLRLANIDCFNTTAEADRLREDLDATIRKLRKVEADLDQARRQLCTELWLSRGQQCSVESIAESRGWDCFKEEP